MCQYGLLRLDSYRLWLLERLYVCLVNWVRFVLWALLLYTVARRCCVLIYVCGVYMFLLNELVANLYFSVGFFNGYRVVADLVDPVVYSMILRTVRRNVHRQDECREVLRDGERNYRAYLFICKGESAFAWDVYGNELVSDGAGEVRLYIPLFQFVLGRERYPSWRLGEDKRGYAPPEEALFFFRVDVWDHICFYFLVLSFGVRRFGRGEDEACGVEVGFK